MKKTICYLLFATAFFACKDDEENWTENTAYKFMPRQCEAVQIKNMQIFYDGEAPNGESIFGVEVLPQNKSAKINDYFILLVNSNRDFQEIPNDYDLINTPIGFLFSDTVTDKHDYDMEQQIEAFLRRNKEPVSSSLEYTSLINIEYRLTELKDMSIYSTTSLFSMPAGAKLNEYVKIKGVNNGCFFDSRKQLISAINKELRLEQYLSYNPIASAFMELQFTSTPAEAPLETQFVVEMEMANGDILRDTTETVNLLP